MAIKRPKLKFLRGNTYVIDQSDSSNAGHPLRFTADSGATEYTHGVTITGTPGQAGATVTFNVPDSAPTNIMYYCSTHGLGMGNHLKTINDPNYVPSYWGGDRAIYAGGYGGSLRRNDISYLNMTTTNNSQDFGDLTIGRNNLAAASSGTKVLIMGGQTGSTTINDTNNAVDYITVATPGNAIDFGELDTLTYGGNGCGNTSRAFHMMGYQYGVTPPTVDTIQYFTPDTPGNSIDFGDVSGGRGRYGAACNSATRALTGGADTTGLFPQNRIEYITIDTPGNSTNFGNLASNSQEPNSTSDETRGLWMGGYEGSQPGTDRIQYITMDTTGNSTDFGNLTNNSYNRGSDQATSNNVRGLLWGTGTNGVTNQYIIIQTTGNATDLSEITETNHLNGTAGSGYAA
jgi:hypothetical protein|tara:strand:- start:145 stop:1350 length:1206 start_codon:yes stop_codon:yes gene_type:complete